MKLKNLKRHKKNSASWVKMLPLLLLAFASFSMLGNPVIEGPLEMVQQTISGAITDETGSPLPGVNVLVVGTSNGTQSDFDGNFSITANQGDIFAVSHI